MQPSEKIKIVFLGNSGVGKTSIILKKHKNQFDDSQTVTIGAAFSCIQIGDKKLEIWDTAGQERYRSLVPMYYRGAKCALIVCGANDMNSIDDLKIWISLLKKEDLPIILILNKCDLNISENNIENFENIAKNNELKYIKTSAKTGEGVDELFERILLIYKKDTTVINSLKLYNNEISENKTSSYCCNLN